MLIYDLLNTDINMIFTLIPHLTLTMIPDLTLRSDLLFLISDQLDTNINTILNNDT